MGKDTKQNSNLRTKALVGRIKVFRISLRALLKHITKISATQPHVLPRESAPPLSLVRIYIVNTKGNINGSGGKVH